VRKITIKLPPRSYDATIEAGLLQRAGAALAAQFPEKPRTFVITTATIQKHWGTVLSESLTAAGFSFEVLEMPDGEKHKNLATLEELASRLIHRGADRASLLVALGGGVVGDVTGFLASVYMRGVRLVQVPTTLLAQVDASIGGKTGVNMSAGKNLLGTFYQPAAVLTDPALLTTLPERDFRSGLYEALKCGVIREPKIFEYMESNRERILARDPEAMEWLVAECVAVKAAVVEADERESGERRILNFGHTIGHALEADTAYKQFLHGEAVAWGMAAAAMISAAMRKAEPATTQRIISTVLAYATLPRITARSKNIVKRMRADKKRVDGVLHFVLPVEIGRVEMCSDVPEDTVVQALDEIRALSQ
jgi:3-dehydroquinate synthase